MQKIKKLLFLKFKNKFNKKTQMNILKLKYCLAINVIFKYTRWRAVWRRNFYVRMISERRFY